jgi:hypothetical protein
LCAWPRLAERNPPDLTIRLALRPKDWIMDLTNALEVPSDAALEDIGNAAQTLAAGERSAITAAAAVGLQKRPDAEALALWRADAVLAHHLKCQPRCRRSPARFGAAICGQRARPEADGAWPTGWALAYARAVAAAADLYAELARRVINY